LMSQTLRRRPGICTGAGQTPARSSLAKVPVETPR